MGTLLLDVGSWDNLSGKVEPLAEVVETLWGEGVVVVLPRELGLDITTGGEGLESLDHVEVLGVNVWVLWEIVVLSALWSNQYVFSGCDFEVLTTATPSRKRYSWILRLSEVGINLVGG